HAHLIFTVNLHGDNITSILHMRSQGSEKLNFSRLHKQLLVKKVKEKSMHACVPNCFSGV
ncbi:hypothetical protein, partial [Pseudomonas aeruginosa]|uniref:hypothetical protein n=1 Tax=Pseudomonas aeruginosa TaxID=287 RepID=UPI00397D3DD6